MDNETLTTCLEALHAQLARLDRLDRLQQREREVRAELVNLRNELAQLPTVSLCHEVFSALQARLDSALAEAAQIQQGSD